MKTLLVVVFLGLCTIILASDDVFRDVVMFKGFPWREKEGKSKTLSPKTFFVRNNLKGNIEFRESKNVSVEVFISGRKDDRKRFRVQYQMLKNDSVVDLQVFLEPEPPNWPLIGGLAGAGCLLFLFVIAVLCVVYKRWKKKKIEEEMLDNEKFEKGKNVLEKRRWWMGSRRRRTTTSGSTADDKKKAREKIKLELEALQSGEAKVEEKRHWWRGSKRRRITTSGSTADEKKKARENIRQELEAIRGGDAKVEEKRGWWRGSKRRRITTSGSTADEKKKARENIKLELESIRGGEAKVKDKANVFEERKEESVSSSGSSTVSGSDSDNNKASPQKKDINQTRRPSSIMSSSLILLSIIAVTMATQLISPQARIVIHVPSRTVMSNSSIFFNEKYQGRLVISSDWKGDVKVFKQFAVSQAFTVVAALDACSNRCEYACDPLTKSCICYRGYKMVANKCEDIDECATGRHSCHVLSTCNNTIGSYRCTCHEGMWGDGITCKKCATTRTPCPENFYQSSECTRTRDRICKACSPKCKRTKYQQYGCGLSFDRKCADISRPLTRAMGNITDITKVRSGAKVIVPTSILKENRLHVQSTNTSFFAKEDRSVNFTLHRKSGFLIDVEVFDTHLIPMYKDYDGRRGSNNPNITLKKGFNEMRSRYCRHPAPDYYELTHKLYRERQTLVETTTCKQKNIYLCPENTEVGEKYHYRVINEPCRLATTDKVCKNLLDCDLQESSDKLYCTRYVSILRDLFGITEETFMETPVYVFHSQACKTAFLSCYQCRKHSCGKCDPESSDRKNHCSCCYKDCLSACYFFYELACSAKRRQNVCAKGDVSEFKLTPKYSDNLRVKFNCYLEHDPPKSLYTLRYRVRYKDGTAFTSHWISKTIKRRQLEKFLSKDMHLLDSLQVSYESEKIREYFLKAERNNPNEDFRYSVAEMNTERATFVPSATTKKIQPLRPFSLQIGDGTWNSRATCRKLSSWSSMLGSDFSKFTTPRIRHLGMTNDGAFGYEVAESSSPPTMAVQISNQESILKYIYTKSKIVNDNTFRSSIRRKENWWVISLEGKLTQCPSVVGLSIIDELDGVKVIENDLLILCPRKMFQAEVKIPRQGKEDRERLFSVYLSDSQQEYKLQVALVDKMSRKRKVQFRQTEKDTRRGPFMILMPLFITTGCVLLALIALLVYAQKTVYKPSKMELASASGWVWVQDSFKEKDKNRLKRRHLILIVFVIIVRLVYSLLFTFTVALAILTLLHADNMKFINDYRSFTLRKQEESKSTSLQMDQYREKEIKGSIDQSADIQRACDHSLGVQLKWLQYNMSCTLQSNHMKMFNKISERIIDRVAADVGQLERQVKGKVRSFSISTRHKISNLKLKVQNYGRRVYDNKWFILPKVAYNNRKRRKKRYISEKGFQISEQLQESQKQSNSQIKGALKILSRKRRSFSRSKFIGFLDFIGVLDQSQITSLEKSINDRINSLEESLKEFKQVMTSGTSPSLPLSTAFLCPLRYLSKKAKKGLEKGIKQGFDGICDTTKSGIHKNIHCFSLNISSFCDETEREDVLENDEKLDSSSQRVYFEKTGIDSAQNTSAANKSSIIKASDGNSYNVEKGDALEEQIDSQKEESLKREGKLKDVSSVYKNEVFSSVRQTVVYVLGTIDALLFVFRCLKTYQIVMKLLYGFEETLEHNVYEFESPTTKQRFADILGRIFDIFSKAFTKFIAIMKNLQKKVFRTNIVPLAIVAVIGAAVFYLVIFLSLNVMNVTVIEELGGYRLISARLDSDLEFTNAAIADHIKYLNEHDMKLYKKSVTKTLRQYNNVLKNFNTAQIERFKEFNEQFCSISKERCIPLKPDFPKVSFSSCIIGRIEAPKFDDYNGTQYRYKLKFESKKYIDAARNIFLDTLYFIIAVVLSFGLITIFSAIVFYFLKSRDMVRIKYIHVYPTLPPDILREYGLEDVNEQHVRNEMKDSTDSINRLKIPEKFVKDSKENSLERQNIPYKSKVKTFPQRFVQSSKENSMERQNSPHKSAEGTNTYPRS